MCEEINWSWLNGSSKLIVAAELYLLALKQIICITIIDLRLNIFKKRRRHKKATHTASSEIIY